MIAFIIYLAGIIPAYLSLKFCFNCTGMEWTIGNRRIAIFFSTASWACVPLGIVSYIIITLLDNDKPASW